MNDISQMGMELGYVTGADLKGPLPARLTPVINGLAATGTPRTDVKARIAHAAPALQIGPLFKAGDVRINPYVVGGGGFYWTHYSDDPLNFSNGSGSLPSNDDYNGGWNAGGGLLIGFARNLGIGFDIRYHDIVYKHGPDTTYWVPAGRISLLF
jgi:opacity protein-like surface antigen